MDVLVFKRHDIVDGSVGRVPGRLTRPQFPAEAISKRLKPGSAILQRCHISCRVFRNSSVAVLITDEW